MSEPPRPAFVPAEARVEHVGNDTVRIGGPGSGVDISLDREMLSALYSAALYYPNAAADAEWVRSELDALAFALRALLPCEWRPPALPCLDVPDPD